MPPRCLSKWQRLPGHRNLKGRAGHTATLVGNRIFVLGGRNGNEFFNDVWVFDTDIEQWQQLQRHAPMNPRAYHTVTLVRDRELWVIGGSDQHTMYGDVHMLNTESLEWASPVARGPLAGKLRGTHAAVVHPLQPNAILVYGGYGGIDSQWLNDLAILHTDTLEWEQLHTKGYAPCARGYHTLSTFGTCMVLFGGKSEAGIVPSDSNLSVYDVAANTWSRPQVWGDAPIPRSNHGAVLLGDNLIVIYGGRNGTQRLSDMSFLQIRAPTLGGAANIVFVWHSIPPVKVRSRKGGEKPVVTTMADSPGGRSAHSLVATERGLYLFGGYGGHGLTFADMYVMRNFPELPGQEETTLLLPPRSSIAMAGSRRRSVAAEEPRKEQVEGWRSTKRPRCSTTGTLDDALELDGSVLPEPPLVDLVSTEQPDRQRAHAKRVVTDTLPQGNKDLVNGVHKEVGELLARRDPTSLEYHADAMAARELELYRKEVGSLQRLVESLKSNMREKSLVEAELRAGKRLVEQEVDILQRQVQAGNEKSQTLEREIASLKATAQVAALENAERQREMNETLLKMRKTEQKLEEREREQGEALQTVKNAELKAEGLARSLEEAKKSYSEVAYELDELKPNIQKLKTQLERKVESLHQISVAYEQEKGRLLKEIAESRGTGDQALAELRVTKESTRALQESVERLSKQLERENAKVDALDQEKEELKRSNASLTSECSQMARARDGADASTELVRSELQTVRALVERSEGEVARLKEAGEQSREHIAALHAAVSKNEDDLKTQHEDNERLRAMVREIEEFEKTQARMLLGHVEKLCCARQFYPC